MDIRILGAHNNESDTTSCVTFVVDGTLAVEAGGLTSRLTIDEQRKLDAVLLTHHHLDHIRDIPAIALNLCRLGGTLDVYATAEVEDVIRNHMLNSVVYPEFQNIPEKRPTLTFLEVEPYALQWIDGHSVLPVPVHHFGEAVGYQISDRQGKTVFYTGDTGPNLKECWKHISPELLIIEVSFANGSEEFAKQTGHLTAGLLEQELISFREVKGYLPNVLAVHLDSVLEPTIRRELAAVSERLHVKITVAQEEMHLTV